MSNIEVLRVPDERIPPQYDAWPEGTLVFMSNPNTVDRVVLADEKPALLAALLEDAGAVQVRVDAGYSDDEVIIKDPFNQVLYGYHWLIPRQEGK